MFVNNVSSEKHVLQISITYEGQIYFKKHSPKLFSGSSEVLQNMRVLRVTAAFENTGLRSRTRGEDLLPGDANPAGQGSSIKTRAVTGVANTNCQHALGRLPNSLYPASFTAVQAYTKFYQA